jgi:hypothetical protein
MKKIVGRLDAGIEREVRLLQKYGIETYESCEGGKGHSYIEPTIAFHGSPEAGWRALSVCLAHALRVAEQKRLMALSITAITSLPRTTRRF